MLLFVLIVWFVEMGSVKLTLIVAGYIQESELLHEL